MQDFSSEKSTTVRKSNQIAVLIMKIKMVKDWWHLPCYHSCSCRM